MTLSTCNQDPNVTANKLYVEASILIASAISDTISYSSAYQSYTSALQNIEMITNEYTQSKVNVNLSNGNLDVAGFTFEQIQELDYSLQLLALAEQDVLQCALLVARSIKDEGDRIMAITSIANMFAESGQDSEALKIADTIERDYFKATVIAEIAATYADSGRFAAALSLADSIPRSENRAQIFYEIAVRYAKSKLFDEALSTTEMIEDKTYRVLAFTEIADEMSEDNHDARATPLLFKSLQIALTITDREYKDIALSAIADKFINRGRYIEAVDIAQKMDNIKDTESKLLAIAHKYIEAGNIPEAFKIAHRIKGESNGSILSEIARKYAELGQVNESIKIISSMDTLSQALVYSSIVDIFISTEQRAEAISMLNLSLHLAESVDDSILKLMTLVEIARQFAETGNFQEALDIADRMESNGSKAVTLTLIAGEYFKSNQNYQADQIMLQALETTKMVEELDDKTGLLCFIADSYTEADQKDKVIELMRQSLALSYSFESTADKDSTLAIIAQKFAEATSFTDAIRIVRVIEDVTTKIDVLLSMASIYSEVGQHPGEEEKLELIKIVQLVNPIGNYW